MVKYILSAYPDEITDFAEQRKHETESTFNSDLSKYVLLLNDAGIGYVELRAIGGHNMHEFSPNKLKRIKSELDENGINVSGISSPLGKVDITDGYSYEHFMRYVDICGYFGTRNLRVFSFFNNHHTPDFGERVLNNIAELVESASRENIVLVHENENGTYASSPGNCRMLYYAIRNPNLTFAFDPGNFIQHQISTGEKVKCVDTASKLLDRLRYAHVKDWSVNTNTGTLPGQGSANWSGILEVLSQKDGVVYLVIEPKIRAPGSKITPRETFLDAVLAFRKLCPDV